MIKNFVAVGLGGALGAMLRYGMTVLGAALYIFGTLVVCILMAWLGCLVGRGLK